MKKQTYYHLVLDRSGSMDSCWNEARQSFQTQLQGFKDKQVEFADQDLFFSYCAFNQVLKFSESILPISQAGIDWREIFPDGMTSLYDAIGISIQFLKTKLRGELENEHTDVVMLILTDGFENASRIFNAYEVKRQINFLELGGKWRFLFLGAGLNVEEATRELDRKGKDSFSFQKNSMMCSMAIVSEEITDFMKLKSKGLKKEEFFKNRTDKNQF
ncbi:vWA domain-containing protein [Algoriphagus boseongensis]|nr:VWA domain-containing protein [Algoriphagus boseongensis]